MSGIAALAAKEAVFATGVGSALLPAIPPSAMDGFAAGTLLSGACFLLVALPRRTGRKARSVSARAPATAGPATARLATVTAGAADSGAVTAGGTLTTGIPATTGAATMAGAATRAGTETAAGTATPAATAPAAQTGPAAWMAALGSPPGASMEMQPGTGQAAERTVLAATTGDVGETMPRAPGAGQAIPTGTPTGTLTSAEGVANNAAAPVLAAGWQPSPVRLAEAEISPLDPLADATAEKMAPVTPTGATRGAEQRNPGKHRLAVDGTSQRGETRRSQGRHAAPAGRRSVRASSRLLAQA